MNGQILVEFLLTVPRRDARNKTGHVNWERQVGASLIAGLSNPYSRGQATRQSKNSSDKEKREKDRRKKQKHYDSLFAAANDQIEKEAKLTVKGIKYLFKYFAWPGIPSDETIGQMTREAQEVESNQPRRRKNKATSPSNKRSDGKDLSFAWQDFS